MSARGWQQARCLQPSTLHLRWGVTMGLSLGRSSDALEHRSRHLFLLQLVHMFASLLERPLIKAEVSPYYSALLGMFKAELENVKVLYDAQITSPPLHRGSPAINKNMPPVAGQLKWALELQQRLEGPHRDLFAISHPYVQSPCHPTGMRASSWGRVWPGVCLLPCPTAAAASLS